MQSSGKRTLPFGKVVTPAAQLTGAVQVERSATVGGVATLTAVSPEAHTLDYSRRNVQWFDTFIEPIDPLASLEGQEENGQMASFALPSTLPIAPQVVPEFNFPGMSNALSPFGGSTLPTQEELFYYLNTITQMIARQQYIQSVEPTQQMLQQQQQLRILSQQTQLTPLLNFNGSAPVHEANLSALDQTIVRGGGVSAYTSSSAIPTEFLSTGVDGVLFSQATSTSIPASSSPSIPDMPSMLFNSEENQGTSIPTWDSDLNPVLPSQGISNAAASVLPSSSHQMPLSPMSMSLSSPLSSSESIEDDYDLNRLSSAMATPSLNTPLRLPLLSSPSLSSSSSMTVEASAMVTPLPSPLVSASSTGSRTHTCSYTSCGRSFTRASNLRTHIKASHENKRPHVCEFCGLAFARLHDMKRHLNKHTENTPFECSICKKKFNRIDPRWRHYRNEHPGHPDVPKSKRDKIMG